MTQVRKLIEAMRDKVIWDKPLTNEEKNFLDNTRLPLYKMLSVEAAYDGNSGLNIPDYADLIALDLVLTYLEQNLVTMSQAASELQFPEEALKPYREGIERAIMFTRAKRNHLQKKYQADMQLIEKTRVLEKQLAGGLTADLAGIGRWSSRYSGN